jgi:hypothetical protein
MGSLSLGTVALIASVGSGTVAAVSQREQGIAVQSADRQKATVEALNETQKQINMRQRMLQGLAAQNAGTLGAVGTGRGSGFGANAMRQINQGQNDLAVSSANESAQVSLLDQAGANAVAAGDLGAATSALGTAGNIFANPSKYGLGGGSSSGGPG